MSLMPDSDQRCTKNASNDLAGFKTVAITYQTTGRRWLYHRSAAEVGASVKDQEMGALLFQTSAITDDSDHLPEYPVKKKVRWTMNFQQGKRYIKHRMGDDLKNKILEHSGIKTVNKQP